jgi:hypothetical protein
MTGQSPRNAAPGAAPDWDTLAAAASDRYRLRVESAGTRGAPRYVAIARTLDVRPYAVVTSDLAELLTILAGVGLPAGAAPGGGTSQ